MKNKKPMLTWSSKDVLDGDLIEVMEGMSLSAKVNVVITKCGEDSMEVDFINVGPISISVGRDEYTLKLDQDEFKSLHRDLYKDFIALAEARAIQVAAKQPETDWRSYDH
jgi:hypothetical protein